MNKKKFELRRLLSWLIPMVLALLCAVCLVLSWIVSNTLSSVRAADRWRGENELRFAQIACFLPEDEKKDVEVVETFRRAVDQAMVDASLVETQQAVHPGQSSVEAVQLASSLYVDAYSGTGKVSVSNGAANATVKAIGVGGEFFLFHPLQLRSGSYISENDLMHDRVILDEELAWRLFGSSDVAGLSVMIAGEPYYVAGVVHRESDFASEKAYLDGAGIFMSYKALNKLTSCGIGCYEIVLPDPISGYGLSVVEKSFPIGGSDVVEVSDRYSLEHLWSIVKDFGARSMRNNDVIYPYWENAARLTEDYLALLMVLVVLFGTAPAVIVVVQAIRYTVRACRFVRKSVPARLRAGVEAHREKKFAKAGK
ncbi:MAG: hypothetical protein E7449_02660 [Ruminococcaceae bacterium]|nr:hypothetical protein [Oscillospiraceae bacterium]